MTTEKEENILRFHLVAALVACYTCRVQMTEISCRHPSMNEPWLTDVVLTLIINGEEAFVLWPYKHLATPDDITETENFLIERIKGLKEQRGVE